MLNAPHSRRPRMPRRQRAMVTEFCCALCQLPIEERQDYVLRVDGEFEHMKCSAPARKPAGRVTPQSTCDQTAQAAQRPIGAVRTFVEDFGDMTDIRDPGKYRLAVRELIRRVDGDP